MFIHFRLAVLMYVGIGKVTGKMLNDLCGYTQQVGFKMNTDKSKIMSNAHIQNILHTVVSATMCLCRRIPKITVSLR